MADRWLQVEVAGEGLALLPERAVWWAEARTLLIADPHFGKPDVFRRGGLPVPEAVTHADLDRLSRLLETTAAQRLIVLGDFYHARPASEDAAPVSLRAWRQSHAELELLVVRGNHDVHAGPPEPELNATVLDEGWRDGSFILRHHPEKDVRGYVLAGHIHPGVRVGMTRADTGRLPCFHFSDAVGVLPAFGGFTGTHGIRTRQGDRVFAIADDAVLQVS